MRLDFSFVSMNIMTIVIRVRLNFGYELEASIG